MSEPEPVDLTTTETPESRCPRCGNVSDRATQPEHSAVPGEGDVSMCLYCGLLRRFNADLSLRAMTAGEIAELPADLRAQLARYERARQRTLTDWRRRN